MKAILTSSLGGSIKVNGKRIPSVLIEKNGLLDKLKSFWPQDAKVLIVCADPNSYEINDSVYTCLKAAFPMSGLQVSEIEYCDGRNFEKVMKLRTFNVLVLAGSIPGAMLLRSVDARMVKLVFGAAVAAIAVEMYGREMGVFLTGDSKVVRFVIGVLSGLLCGLFGVGALLAAYVGRVTDRVDAFKANISAVFVVENTVRLISYTLLGVITLGSLRQTFMLIPAALVGLFAGIYSSKKLDEALIKRVVIVLLLISGILLIIRNI